MCLAADEILISGPERRFAKSLGAKRAGLLRTVFSTDWGSAEKHDLLTSVNSSGNSNRTENRLCDGRTGSLPYASCACAGELSAKARLRHTAGNGYRFPNITVLYT